MKRRPVTTFALIATILLTLSASVASVTAAPSQVFGFFSAGQFPLYVAINNDDTVSKVDSGGNVTTFASGFNGPTSLAFDSSGNLYVANFTGNTVSKVDSGGNVTTFATGFNAPIGLAFDANGNLYVGEVQEAASHGQSAQSHPGLHKYVRV